jgi:integrase
MSVYKRGKTYWYEFVWDGEKIQHSARTGDADVARVIEAAHRTSLAKGEVGIRERKKVPTLAEFGPRFLDQVKMDCAAKPLTVLFYQSKLRLLLDNSSLGKLRLDRIGVDDIEAFKLSRSRSFSRRKKKLSAASVNRELSVLRRMLRVAADLEFITRVPKIKLLRGEGSRDFTLSRSLEPKYVGALPERMQQLATFLIDTGLRVGEALKLEWPAVDLRGGFVRVRAIDSKNSKSRAVPLTPRVRELLDAMRHRSGLVFKDTDGCAFRQRWLDRQHAKVREDMGLPEDFVIHSLRHTFGTRLGEVGCDAYTIMKLMGHRTITISAKYVHPSSESDKLAIERLAAAQPTVTQITDAKVTTPEIGAKAISA